MTIGCSARQAAKRALADAMRCTGIRPHMASSNGALCSTLLNATRRTLRRACPCEPSSTILLATHASRTKVCTCIRASLVFTPSGGLCLPCKRRRFAGNMASAKCLVRMHGVHQLEAGYGFRSRKSSRSLGLRRQTCDHMWLLRTEDISGLEGPLGRVTTDKPWDLDAALAGSLMT